MKKWLFILAIIPAIFFSCREDIDEINVHDINYTPSVQTVNATIGGLVSLEDGSIVSGATVRIGDLQTNTNEYGLFEFKGVEVNAKGTYIIVDHAGYFPASTRIYPLNGSKNFSRFQLLDKSIIASVDATTGGTVSLDNATITLPANGVVDAQNNAYAGSIQVAAKWIDPTASDLNEVMPGGLFGVNTEGAEELIYSYGMLAVELQDVNGNELQIAKGKQAELSFNVPSELSNSAPAQIPLWSFDEQLGVWIQEGSASLENGKYTGKVSHFSYWNIDVPVGTPLVFVNGAFENTAGEAYANHSFRIQIPNLSSGATTFYGSTDDSGAFSGYVPAGENIVFELYAECGVLASFEVAALSSDTDLGAFVHENTDYEFNIEGRLIDCDGNPLSNAFVHIAIDQELIDYSLDYYVYTNDMGIYNTNMIFCNDIESVEITAYDLVNTIRSEVHSFDFANPLTPPDISVCDVELEEYIHLSIGEHDFNDYLIGLQLYTDGTFTDSIADPINNVIRGTRVPSVGFPRGFYLYLLDIAVGSYTGDDVNLFFQAPEGGGYFFYNPDNGDSFTTNITSNGGSGAYLMGNFSGSMSSSSGVNSDYLDQAISGEFRIKIP